MNDHVPNIYLQRHRDIRRVYKRKNHGVYHNTRVVGVTPEHITLDTGGWKTVTTKRRMNQASTQFNLGYSVYQQKGQWFVSYRGVTRPFDQDEIILERG